jgi:hypothetical protein
MVTRPVPITIGRQRAPRRVLAATGPTSARNATSWCSLSTDSACPFEAGAAGMARARGERAVTWWRARESLVRRAGVAGCELAALETESFPRLPSQPRGLARAAWRASVRPACPRRGTSVGSGPGRRRGHWPGVRDEQWNHEVSLLTRGGGGRAIAHPQVAGEQHDRGFDGQLPGVLPATGSRRPAAGPAPCPCHGDQGTRRSLGVRLGRHRVAASAPPRGQRPQLGELVDGGQANQAVDDSGWRCWSGRSSTRRSWRPDRSWPRRPGPSSGRR